ncbi:MBL fold metallo-hydrolase [Thioalkalicoccus limnaeus]|uniref:MBL fold metallo-hydrolase n=1 Tax=Thioalkalicoccus limnaeus TaxID=120681 RepID=A0ABV4BBF6_9GAMM
MKLPPFQQVADGIYCVETGLYRHGLAACYLVREGDRLAFVDTGTARTAPALLALIGELGLDPSAVDYVIPTHVHLDHAGGSGQLMQACPNARLVIHPKGAPHMIDPAKLMAGAMQVYGEEAFARDFGELVPVPEERVWVADDGMAIDLAGRTLTFIDTPGHANHHGCLFDATTQGLFTGDTFGISYREFDTDQGPLLFAPTTPVAFDPEVWLESLDRIMALSPREVYLTHYGRIEDPAGLVDGLRQNIRDLAALALAEEGRADAARQSRLEQAVTANLFGRARDHGVTLSDEELLRLFSVDIALNAQGLEVWLRRRERRATSA